MPWLPKGRDRRTQAEKNKSWGGDTSFYRKAPWKKLRRIILDKNPLCVYCLKDDIVKPAQVVDHIIPIKKGGADLDESNLQGLCHKCHNKKTYDENRQK
tara:strand:- start:1214 stop:1510 length:297 start_codon:yes stop_codon:yes gene_type:complete